MLSFIISLGIAAILPILILAAAFDIAMFFLAFSFKALKFGFKVFFGILGFIGTLLTVPFLLGLLLLIF